MAHGTKEHLLLDARAGWRDARLSPGLEKLGGRLRLRTQPGSLRPLADASGSFGGLALPTGLAVSGDGRVLVLDTGADTVKEFDPCGEVFRELPCVGGTGSEPRRFRGPRGLAVSRRGDLYVADTENRRVQIFALKGLALRSIWGPLRVVRDGVEIGVRETAASAPKVGDSAAACASAAVFEPGTWRPWDVVLSEDCRAFVSDYENGLVHVFDSKGRWQTAYTGEGTAEGEGVGEAAPPFERPTHLALDKECRLYVVQEGKDYVTVLDAGGKFAGQVKGPDEVRGRFCPAAVAVDAEGRLCVSDRLTRRVYSFAAGGDGALKPASCWRGFEGESLGLAFDLAGNALVSDAGRRAICLLEARATYELEGRYFSEPLDSRIYRCQWHRVVLDACVAPGTQIRVDTFSAESPKTAAEVAGLPESRWATAQTHARVGSGEWDCLVQSPPGRFLWLRLSFASEGAETPELCAARVHFPRASSLQYLPGVYSEDEQGRDFLDRFLSIFDTLRDQLSEKLDRLASYFDPASAPAEAARPGAADFLSWLASWLDLSLERHWPEEKRRRLVAEAHRLYALRGTPEGLRLHLRLYTGAEPRLVEHFRLRRWAFVGHARLGEQTALWSERVVGRLQLDEFSRIGEFQLLDTGDPLRDPFHAYAHRLTVFVPLRAEASETERRTVERIVEMAKPAHVLARVEFVRPRLRVGVQSFVGVDTVVGRYPAETVAGRARLGYDSMLGPSRDEAAPPTMRVGVRARVGTSTLID